MNIYRTVNQIIFALFFGIIAFTVGLNVSGINLKWELFISIMLAAVAYVGYGYHSFSRILVIAIAFGNSFFLLSVAVGNPSSILFCIGAVIGIGGYLMSIEVLFFFAYSLFSVLLAERFISINSNTEMMLFFTFGTLGAWLAYKERRSNINIKSETTESG